MSYFSFDGRIGRITYAKQVALLFVPFVITIVLSTAITSQTGNAVVSLGAWLFWFWLWSYPGIKRLHDGGYSGGVYFWSLLPLLNLILIIWMFFARGEEEENEFGPPPRSKNYAGAVTEYIEKKATSLSRKANDVVEQIRSSQNDYNTDDIDIYSIVANEVEIGQINGGLMTKAIALADGDENSAKAKYIKLRVNQLKAENSNLSAST